MSDLFFFRDEYLAPKPKLKLAAKKAEAFQDAFETHYDNVPAVELSDDELMALRRSIFTVDVECFRNYFLAAFRSLVTGKILEFEQTETQPLNVAKLLWAMQNFCTVGFNSNEYDIVLLQLALRGLSNKQLHDASKQIIVEGSRPFQMRKRHKLTEPTWDHMDLIEVAPLRGSLKLYAGRLHTPRMQDLPVNPNAILTAEDIINVRAYCRNDIGNTELLFRELESQILLRVNMSRQFRVDLRSKSDAQIAEAVISSELARESGARCEKAAILPGTAYRYRVPSFITYRTPALQAMLETVRSAEFVVDANGYVDMPPEIAELKLALGNCVYRMGIGGLHSSEKTAAYVADDDTLLIDRDVVSYYPSIILNQGLAPQHLGLPFLTVYRGIVQRRIAAKKSGDKVTADSLKITINGSFGKLGSKYSVLYAPDLMLQVTLTGQLSLLLLIEMIEDLGISVVSANTDGVVIRCPRTRVDELQQRIAWWETLTGFQTEETRYKAIYSRDVNNYVALKDDGKTKVKGCYAERGSAGDSALSKNPENLICNDAVLALISKGIPIEQTVRECSDIRRFVTIRNVTGGAHKSGVYLGKVIRWYYSTEMRGEINRATKGDKIPNSDAARPLMQLPAEFPADVDYERYIAAAREILYDIGFEERPKPAAVWGPLFDLA